jgi:hypothetical protein
LSPNGESLCTALDVQPNDLLLLLHFNATTLLPLLATAKKGKVSPSVNNDSCVGDITALAMLVTDLLQPVGGMKHGNEGLNPDEMNDI